MVSDVGGLIRKDAVHRSIYTDPEIFELEMERIFSRSWVYLAHISEINEPGDYKTTVIGKHPVIVSHLGDGAVTALINRCRHRGATVCQHEVRKQPRFPLRISLLDIREHGEINRSSASASLRRGLFAR